MPILAVNACEFVSEDYGYPVLACLHCHTNIASSQAECFENRHDNGASLFAISAETNTHIRPSCLLFVRPWSHTFNHTSSPFLWIFPSSCYVD